MGKNDKNKSARKRRKKSSRISMQAVTATVSTTLVLLLLGIVMFFVFTAYNVSNYVKENVGFSIVMSEDMPEADVLKLKQELEKEPFVKSAQYISKQQALKEMSETVADPEEFTGYNPFPASIEVKLHSSYANTDSIARIERRIKAKTSVREVLYQKDLINTMNRNISYISIILLVLAAALTLISFALINNTIRLSVYAKRFTLNTMKLVGASKGFIRKPFIKRHIWIGIIAAIVADLILCAGLYLLFSYQPEIRDVITLPVIAIVTATVFVLGCLISLICSWLSINKYLKMSANTLYYI